MATRNGWRRLSQRLSLLVLSTVHVPFRRGPFTRAKGTGSEGRRALLRGLPSEAREA